MLPIDIHGNQRNLNRRTIITGKKSNPGSHFLLTITRVKRMKRIQRYLESIPKEGHIYYT